MNMELCINDKSKILVVVYTPCVQSWSHIMGRISYLYAVCAIFKPYHGENKLFIDKTMIMSLFLSWTSLDFPNWNVSLQVDSSVH